MNITFTTEHKTDELLSMQEHYKTNYDMQKTTQKVSMTSILMCIFSAATSTKYISLVVD